jgi:hypothetical protein
MQCQTHLLQGVMIRLLVGVQTLLLSLQLLPLGLSRRGQRVLGRGSVDLRLQRIPLFRHLGMVSSEGLTDRTT